MEKRIDFALPAGAVLASSERTYTVVSVLGAVDSGSPTGPRPQYPYRTSKSRPSSPSRSISSTPSVSARATRRV